MNEQSRVELIIDRAYADALRGAIVGDKSSIKLKDRKTAFRELWELTCRMFNKLMPLHENTALGTLWDSCGKSTW